MADIASAHGLGLVTSSALPLWRVAEYSPDGHGLSCESRVPKAGEHVSDAILCPYRGVSVGGPNGNVSGGSAGGGILRDDGVGSDFAGTERAGEMAPAFDPSMELFGLGRETDRAALAEPSVPPRSLARNDESYLTEGEEWSWLVRCFSIQGGDFLRCVGLCPGVGLCPVRIGGSPDPPLRGYEWG